METVKILPISGRNTRPRFKSLPFREQIDYSGWGIPARIPEGERTVMLFKEESLQKTLFMLMAKKPGLRADWLHKRSCALYKSCSIQAVYKELRKMEALGMITKTNDRYSISLTWILNTMEFLDSIYARYSQSGFLEFLLPEEKERRIWRCTDLQQTDRIWIQLNLALLNVCDSRQLLCWTPHPWFSVVHKDRDLQFLNAMRIKGGQAYIIVGGREKLDDYYLKDWPEDVYTWSQAKGPFEEKQSSYLTVIDDYCFEIKLDPDLTEIVEEFFSAKVAPTKVDPTEAIKVLCTKGQIKLTLEKAPKKAAKLRKQFYDFFGIS